MAIKQPKKGSIILAFNQQNSISPQSSCFTQPSSSNFQDLLYRSNFPKRLQLYNFEKQKCQHRRRRHGIVQYPLVPYLWSQLFVVLDIASRTTYMIGRHITTELTYTLILFILQQDLTKSTRLTFSLKSSFLNLLSIWDYRPSCLLAFIDMKRFSHAEQQKKQCGMPYIHLQCCSMNFCDTPNHYTET